MNSKKSLENPQEENLSFEDALNQLEELTRSLESGTSDLEKSIEQYEKGSQLIKICEKKLGDAKLKVEKIVKDKQGNVTTEEFQD